MDRGRPLLSFATNDSLVSSPNAAKTGACLRTITSLRVFGDMALDILHLLCPATVISEESFRAATAGDFIEAGFRDEKQGAGSGRLQREFDEGRRLSGIIDFRIDGIGMPG